MKALGAALSAASNETRGHLTAGNAKVYAEQVKELLATAPQKTMWGAAGWALTA
jgi:hypothetical protein